MTQENARKFADYLRMKVDFWREATENEYDAGFDKAIARHEVYAFVLARFEKLNKDEPTESLHEMAKRLCASVNYCNECPIGCGDIHCLAGEYAEITDDEAARQINAIRAWAVENPPKPVKTYKDDLFEKLPGVGRDKEGYPFSPFDLFYRVSCAKNKEFIATVRHGHKGTWDKPLGYWEA